MDFNQEYAAHQKALMYADSAGTVADRDMHLAKASGIAERIGTFQRGLGAAAACAWSTVHVSAPARI